jgi:YVTN family beta-propeller protein
MAYAISESYASVINTTTNTVSTVIAFSSPIIAAVGVAITPDGNQAYITATSSGSPPAVVIVVSTATDTINTFIDLSYNYPTGIAITPDGTTAYIAHNNVAGPVSVIDCANNTVSTTITVGSNPVGVAISPDGATAYVTNSGSGTVSVIDVSTNTVSATITVGSVPNPTYISITPDGTTAYVINPGSNSISPITLSTNTVGTAITVGSTPIAFGQFIQPFNQPNPPNYNYLAGGLINKFRNGTMDIWQRGTSAITVSTSGAYTADGWIVVPTGSSCTVAATNGRTGGLTYYSMLITGATSITDILLKQRIESYVAAPLAGQTVTVQAQVYNNTGGAITPTLTVKHAGSQDNWTSPTTDISAVNLQSCPNGAWTQVAYTFVASTSSSNGLEITIDFGNNFSSGSKSVQVTELDIRSTPGLSTGLNSSPPLPELRSITVELPGCQRYYRKSYTMGTAPGNAPGAGYCNLTFSGPNANIGITMLFGTPMRTSPTISIYDGSGTSGKYSYYSSGWNNGGAIAFIGTNDEVLFALSNIASALSINFDYTASAEL